MLFRSHDKNINDINEKIKENFNFISEIETQMRKNDIEHDKKLEEAKVRYETQLSSMWY